jgi:hypothetical protein
MATINLTPSRVGVQPPSPGMRPAGSPVGAAVAELGAVVRELGEATDRARQEDQVQAARVQHVTRQADLRGLFEQNDPSFGPDPVQGWTAASARARDEIAQQIPDARARSAFLRQADMDLARDRIEITRFAARRQAESSRAQLDGELDAYAIEATRAPTDAGRAAVVQRATDAILARVSTGALPADAAERLRQGFSGRLEQARVLRDISANPQAALRSLNAGAYAIADPVQLERLTSQARTAIQTQAAQVDVASRAQDRARQGRADEAEMAFGDAQRRSDTAGMQTALAILRRDGRPGQYASAADALYGRLEPPTTPQMEAWLEERLRSRSAPLTRDELDRARAERRINDTTFRRGLSSLSAREDARFREAEAFVDRALEVPSANIPDAQLVPAQREALRARNRIVNDLVLERTTNPDVDPLTFVRERLRVTDPEAERARANSLRALSQNPTQAQTWEAFDQLQQQWTEYQADRARFFLNRTGVEQPRATTASGQVVPITPDALVLWRRRLEAAGVQRQGAQR